MKIILANPRGFCAGVDRAISIVELALEIHGAPIYVRHEVVHNRFVVDFFDFYWDIYHYPVFNVADIAICIGAGLLALDAFKGDKNKQKSGQK